MQIENPIKVALKAGKTVFGVFVPIPSPDVVEILALAGFDFVMIDAEHGRIGPEDAYPMILAAEAHNTTMLARVGQNDRQVILKFLDLGVSGVMIPQTTLPEDARRAVDSMRYYPDGGRGLAGGRTFGYGVGTSMKELVPRINERVLTIIQFEHIDSLPHLDELIATPGLDLFFVGPTDLAQSMGYPGEPFHPEVEKIVEQVVAASKRAGVALGTVAPTLALTKQKVAQGFQMIVANAPGLLMQASRDLLTAARQDGV